MRIAIVTFDGFNELDSFVALHILNRVPCDGWKAEITAPAKTVTSMNGLRVAVERPLEFANEADVVLFGSGRQTRQIVQAGPLMSRFRLDPAHQLIGSQCSGALILAQLGLLDSLPACTDAVTRPWLETAGVRVLDQPFFASGNMASAGGCLASQYLATWVIWRLIGKVDAEKALRYVLPVGEEREYLARALGVVEPFIESNLRTTDVGRGHLSAVAGDPASQQGTQE